LNDAYSEKWAVDNAPAGDTIIIMNRTYTENVDVQEKIGRFKYNLGKLYNRKGHHTLQ
jgi:hypothetical protein